MQRRIDIGHVGDDQRVVAAHLQRQHLLGLAAEIAMEVETRRRAAGEQYAVDITIFPAAPGQWFFRPASRLITPSGTPACCHSWTVISAVAGVSSLGLNTMVLPAISAGMMCPLGRWPGKL